MACVKEQIENDEQRFFGLLNYFRPVDVFRANTWPLTSMSVLFLIFFACWFLGLLVFHRREIPTA